MYLSYEALVAFIYLSVLGCSADEGCQSGRLVVYKVIFSTYWDREKFPKQYPEWRPPAQWSKLVGFSHDSSYHLFRLGEVASSAVKEFAETGSTDSLDKQPTFSSATKTGQGSDYDRNRMILDGFSAPPIEQGVGSSTASLFVDGNHTRVSVISKLVPSPDWFVGLDSLNLCENGRFIDSVTVEADPIDAGTDNGFTFTSPNWQTIPPGGIFRITNVYPAHPAGSFHYPEKPHLPTIASFTFIKEKEYELSEVFQLNQDRTEVLSMSEVNKYSYQVGVSTQPSPSQDGTASTGQDDDKTIITFVSAESRQRPNEIENEIPTIPRDDVTTWTTSTTGKPPKDSSTPDKKTFKKSRRQKLLDKNGEIGDKRGYHASTAPEDFFKKTYESHFLEASQVKIYRPDIEEISSNDLAESESKSNDVTNTQKVKSNDVIDNEDEFKKLMEVYETRKKTSGIGESLHNKLKMRRRKRRRRIRHRSSRPRNCKVGSWSEWSECSKSCGIGESIRSRKVLRTARRGGKPCPTLTDLKWCGSARNCRNSYFNW